MTGAIIVEDLRGNRHTELLSSAKKNLSQGLVRDLLGQNFVVASWLTCYLCLTLTVWVDFRLGKLKRERERERRERERERERVISIIGEKKNNGDTSQREDI